MENLDPLNEESSSLDIFKRRLERKAEPQSGLRSTRLPKTTFSLRRDWSSGESDFKLKPVVTAKSDNWIKNFFWGTLIFFLATSAVAIYVLFFSTNIVSANNIDLSVNGPTQLRSGDELVLETTVLNRNKVTLRDVSLTITYPAGTVDSLESDKGLPLWRESLGDVAPGQKIVIASRAIIFGAQNSNQKINLKIEYHIPDSNAVFTKETQYQFLIGSATLDISLDLPSEINISKNFTAKIKLTSNSKTILRQLVMKLETPVGFNLLSSDVPPISSRQVWFLGDLSPGAKREIVITGNLSGQTEEIKSFRVIAGLDKSATGDEISTEYGSLFKTINLKKDFVSATLNLGGKSSVAPGEKLDGEIFWKNNLADKVINGTLELFLTGSFDKRSVGGSSGFYNSLTNSIVWDKNLVSGLDEIGPGGQAQTRFNLTALGLNDLSIGNADPIKLRLVFRGTRVNADESTEEIISESEKTIKIGTLAQLDSLVTYYTGPFKNSGPLPPKVESETTYTVTWRIVNPTNEIKNAKAVAILPLYVKWLSNISPLDEKMIYNNTDRKLTWDLGSVEPGTGDRKSSREVSFQISLTPSLSQVNQTVDLVNSVSFNGVDVVTGEIINLSKSAVDTRFSTDPGFNAGQDKITE